MKLDRFWVIQIIIGVALFALLIGSYLLSSGVLTSKPASLPPPAAVADAEPAVETGKNTGESPVIAATCAPAGTEPSPDVIGVSLGSNDSARQQSCVTFLQAESQQGDLGAELWLGRAYHNGWGVDKSLTQAAAHYRKAAAADDKTIRESAQQWLLQLEKEQ